MKPRYFKNSPILNYLLSMGFIVFLIVILVLMLVISRFVLSDVNPIGEHVKQTSDLLKGVDEVQKVVEKQIDENQNATLDKIINRKTQFDLNEISAEITDLNYYNVNENKSIITLFFDRKIHDINKTIYYVEIKNIEDLVKNEVLVYEEDGKIKTGNFISYLEKDNIVVIDIGDQNLIKKSIGDILGIVFYKND